MESYAIRKSGGLRLALSTSEEWLRAFQVRFQVGTMSLAICRARENMKELEGLQKHLSSELRLSRCRFDRDRARCAARRAEERQDQLMQRRVAEQQRRISETPQTRAGKKALWSNTRVISNLV